MTYKAQEEPRIVAGVVLLATLAAALVVTLGLDMTHGAALQAPYPLNASFPPIRDAHYSRSCEVYRAYQDGTAFAICDVDRRTYRWEPVQERWSTTTTTR